MAVARKSDQKIKNHPAVKQEHLIEKSEESGRMGNRFVAQKAPILLFVYNRLDHTKAVVDALKTCPEAKDSDLFIFSDAPKDSATAESVQAVRNYIRVIDGFKTVQIDEKTQNWGIEKSEIDGITTIIKKYGRVIVLEDDIVVGPYFLRYMNLALDKYQNCPEVYSVTGYSFLNGKETDNLPEYVFLPLASVWGWGTWKEKWKQFKKKIDLEDIKILFNREARANFNRGYCYADMLYKQYKAGYITWDVAWYWTIFVNNGMTLTPTKTMVNNIGMDGSGVHYTDKNGKSRIEDIKSRVYSDRLPDDTVAKKEYCTAMESTLKRERFGDRGIICKMRIQLYDAVRWKMREMLFQWEKSKTSGVQ